MALDSSFLLAERLRGFNKYYLSLTSLRKLVVAKAKGYTLEDGLLFY